MKQSEKCTYCGTVTKLKKYEIGHDVAWLCPYCPLDFTFGTNPVLKSFSAMLNKLEKRLKSTIN